jgi:hypothetical protein
MLMHQRMIAYLMVKTGRLRQQDKPAPSAFCLEFLGRKDLLDGIRSVSPCYHLLIRPDGIQQGMSAQIIKAVLSQALLFVSKEQFEHWALAFMVLFAKVAAR